MATYKHIFCNFATTKAARLMIIGREKERNILKEAYNSEYSEFVAVYGRRRIGKTFLVREAFDYNFTFQHTGVYKAPLKKQLRNFRDALKMSGMKKVRIPSDWTDAFFLLAQFIKESPEGKKVIFIDEIPWLDTPRSGFLSALEYFWNSFASARKDILLIICGSATSWIINKVLKNHGGLHNRVTYRIHLQPFTLHECELYAQSMGLRASHYDLLEYYMILGGVAFYWSRLQKALSVAQNIDSMIFAESGFLHNEFNELYDSLFNEPESYIKVIETLGTIRIGMTREELVKEGGITSNGKLTRILEDLTECGFIKRMPSYGGKTKDDLIQLVDNFTIFYYKYMKENKTNDERFWSNSYNSPTRAAWCGLAFERVCFQHIPQIKSALGISGVSTHCYSWKAKRSDAAPGAQVDMVIDRADNVINLCEIKFSKAEYSISGEYIINLSNKTECFTALTKTSKSIFLTMITTCGLSHNEYWNQVQAEITAEDLFKP